MPNKRVSEYDPYAPIERLVLSCSTSKIATTLHKVGVCQLFGPVVSQKSFLVCTIVFLGKSWLHPVARCRFTFLLYHCCTCVNEHRVSSPFAGAKRYAQTCGRDGTVLEFCVDPCDTCNKACSGGSSSSSHVQKMLTSVYANRVAHSLLSASGLKGFTVNRTTPRFVCKNVRTLPWRWEELLSDFDALCSEENSGPGIRLSNFFWKEEVGRWTVFSALSGWVSGFSGLLYYLSRDELHPLLGVRPRGGDTSAV
eukprot:1657761-Pyramimonas_sp.AAC.1